MTQAVALRRRPAESLPGDVLSDAMREGSMGAHRAAEAAPFVERLVAGRLDAADYLAYVERLHAVYVVLEQLTTRHRHDPILGAVYDERLLRSDALARDVRWWRERVDVGDHRSSGGRSAAVAAYRSRLHAAAEQPWLLVAHHYTRYLGDLSGGRILARRLADRFGDAGLAFYDFAAIPEPVVYKRAYRDQLDGLGLSSDQHRAVVAEVRAAFDCNRALLAELD